MNESGQPPGSQNALKRGQVRWQESMVKAQKALGRDWKFKPPEAPKPATALEACWGWGINNADVRLKES